MAAIFTTTKKNSLDDHHLMNGQGKGGAYNNGILFNHKENEVHIKMCEIEKYDIK